MIIYTRAAKFNKRRYQAALRMKRRTKNIEVYPKKAQKEYTGRGLPEMKTTNPMPDLSCPDRNEGMKITYGGPRENWAVVNRKKRKILDPEMEEREIKAQREIEKKRKRVAPIYNKGGYQYLTETDDPKTIGRK